MLHGMIAANQSADKYVIVGPAMAPWLPRSQECEN
jgi:hypothetical protein